MNKKILVFGGGTGMSCLLKGLKEFPVDITAVVSVCDDGGSTGILRDEFDILAVGDIRKVLVSLSQTSSLVEELLNHRFTTEGSLNQHTVGNILLTASQQITGNFQKGIELLGTVLNLRGKVMPVTESNVVLMGLMDDDSVVVGEHNITNAHKKIKKVFYQEKPTINRKLLEEIAKADLILFSMGSLYTSLLPCLICDEIKQAIDRSKAPIAYVCNLFTQPGETDGFKVSDHIRVINNYLKKKKIATVVANCGNVNTDLAKKYLTSEQKDCVVLDRGVVKSQGVSIIEEDLVKIEHDHFRHDYLKLGFLIFSLVLNEKKVSTKKLTK